MLCVTGENGVRIQHQLNEVGCATHLCEHTKRTDVAQRAFDARVHGDLVVSVLVDTLCRSLSLG